MITIILNIEKNYFFYYNYILTTKWKKFNFLLYIIKLYRINQIVALYIKYVMLCIYPLLKQKEKIVLLVP